MALHACPSPNDPSVEPLFQQALALHKAEQNEAALTAYEQVLALAPQHYQALLFAGSLCVAQNHYQQAAIYLSRASALRSDDPALFTNLGIAFHELKLWEAALASHDHALQLQPDQAEWHNNRGNTLQAMRRWEEALACYEKALQLKPDFANAFNNQAVILRELGRWEDACTSYQQALGHDPQHAQAHYNLGQLLKSKGQWDTAVRHFQQALTLQPHYPDLPGVLLHTQMMLCDWADFEARRQSLIEAVQAGAAQGQPASPPFPLLALCDDPALHRQAASAWAHHHLIRPDLIPPEPTTPPHPDAAKLPVKIKLGYFSADFHEHATLHLMAELFELHDRSRFEVFVFSYGPPIEDAARQRLRRSVDHFLEVQLQSDVQVAAQARQLGIQIALDLKGYTESARLGIFAHRAAPVQMSYLGYPGTIGSPFMDCVLADPVVIPPEERAHFSEQVLELPHSYQVNDRRRPRPNLDITPNRTSCGLPATGFVFCCFNQSYKILPDLFDSWMRLLQQVPGSMLWLLASHPIAQDHLRQAANARGIEAERLVFAPKQAQAQHLARHACADLFLDTWPYNAHTTASDALWAGLPVLTRSGRSFASRVGASLLMAVDLPELVTESAAAYEAKAMELAQDPEALQSLRARLVQAREHAPLFDSPGFTQAYENRLERAWAQASKFNTLPT
jgi:predicted O-linked N-acetylglucosamine transferase (SPINDLY family)